MPTILAVREGDPDFWHYSDELFRLRHEVFLERLRWDVGVFEGREIDDFDTPDCVYMVATDDDGQVVGGWRLNPTTGPYMLRDVFPELLRGLQPPAETAVWEISRFAMSRRRTSRSSTFGLGAVTLLLLAETVRFALSQNIRCFVLVVSTSVERLLKTSGLRIQRFSAPMTVGKVETVACWVEIDLHTRQVLLGREPV